MERRFRHPQAEFADNLTVGIRTRLRGIFVATNPCGNERGAFWFRAAILPRAVLRPRGRRDRNLQAQIQQAIPHRAAARGRPRRFGRRYSAACAGGATSMKPPDWRRHSAA
jgi:hypothetical protein